MKLPQPAPSGAARGSFGIPEEVHPETLRRQREEQGARAATPDEAGDEAEPEAAEEADDEGTPAPEDKSKAAVEAMSPLKTLAKLGIDLTAEDFSRLVYKGYIEKVVPISFNPMTKEPITATFRTLTPDEYDEIDECLATEVRDLAITREGMEQRRSAWTMAFCMLGIDGRLFVKAQTKKDGDSEVVDFKATALKRKRFIGQLNAQVVNRALSIFQTFTLNLDLVVRDPEVSFFGKP
jgi:hypothetical protein